ncbi:SWI/SNF complex subunit SMARCC2, partial [Diachasma alloeum]|uniref:SWI/SNF complex subunit SMARCC2 n=1 Tax=Diachasma alloeum TaxID=454923 RepID=UPI0007384934
MSRAVRKRRRRCPGMPEERVLTQEMLFQTAFAKWEKRLVNLPSSHSYPCPGKQERLAGGGEDVPEADQENELRASTAVQEKAPSGKERTSSGKEMTPPEVVIEAASSGSPASPSAPKLPQESTGDKEVDEIFDSATQHLREVGKALATLTGNVEHDLKLMLEEVAMKIENWRENAQSEVDSGINALNDIRKRVIFQNRENETKIAEIEATKAMYEKAMIDSGMKTTIGTDPSYSRIQLPPLQPGGVPPVPGSQGLQQTPGVMTPAKVMSQLPPGSQLQADGSVLMPSGAVVPLSAVSSIEIPGNGHGSQRSEVPPGVSSTVGGAFGPSTGTSAFGPSAPGSAFDPSAPGNSLAPAATPGGVFGQAASSGVAFGPSTPSGVAFGPSTLPGSAYASSAPPGSAFGAATPGRVGPSTIPIEQLALYNGKFQMPANAQFSQNQREIE